MARDRAGDVGAMVLLLAGHTISERDVLDHLALAAVSLSIAGQVAVGVKEARPVVEPRIRNPNDLTAAVEAGGAQRCAAARAALRDVVGVVVEPPREADVLRVIAARRIDLVPRRWHDPHGLRLLADHLEGHHHLLSLHLLHSHEVRRHGLARTLGPHDVHADHVLPHVGHHLRLAHGVRAARGHLDEGLGDQVFVAVRLGLHPEILDYLDFGGHCLHRVDACNVTQACRLVLGGHKEEHVRRRELSK
mmetsp:Transcript_84864/g.236781  ORF Transcript_84864/g.236781 Transcript_84864/m.236781 type:complete len:248 (-) Transcript_84864:325-1068(-)